MQPEIYDKFHLYLITWYYPNLGIPPCQVYTAQVVCMSKSLEYAIDLR